MFYEIGRTCEFFKTHHVARTQPLSTWRRWISWQVKSRLLAGPFNQSWLEGTKLVVERGMTGATGNIYCGLHEFADMAFVLHLLNGASGVQSPRLFVDVGANVGSYTVLAAGVAGVSVLSIEPAPAAFAGLMRNIDVNHLRKKVDAVECAVGSERGALL